MKKTSNPYRLAREAVPVLYDIRLEPDVNRFTFSGAETVTLDVRRPFTRLSLHAKTLAFPDPHGNGMHRVEAPLPRDFERALAKLRGR